MPARPKSLLISSPKTHRSFPSLRTCLSHPSTSSTQMEHSNISTMTFSSVKNLFSPPTKRQRSEIISSSVDVSNNSSNFFIDAFELAEKLNESALLTIFDCGSPFRHSERRIRGASLLRVADKVSRKRLKIDSLINEKLVNGTASIILYDDQTSTSSGLKCVLKEIERFQFAVRPMVRILNCSFSRFFDLFPNLCESDSMAMNEQEASASSPSSFSLRTLNNCEIEHPMTHIIDGVFIGGESNAEDLELLKSEQIRRIINVTSHVPLYHPTEFQYLHLPADDTQKQNLIDNFDETFHFIHQAIVNKENVLVHCVAGISRSPAIVIAFLMRHANMKMNEAYELVKRKRSIVSPNFNFMGQLLEYEKRLQQQQDHAENT